MSLNRIRLAQSNSLPFPILFPDEKLYFTSTSSVQLEYDNSGGYPGSGQQLLILKGTVFISNIRVIYLPHSPTVSFQSLSIPLQNLEDGKISESWLGLGGSTYSGSVKSVQDEGFTNPWGLVKLSFSSSSQGPEFKNTFDHMRSRLGAAPMQYVEPLPTYSTLGDDAAAAGSSSAPAFHPAEPELPPSYN